MSSHACLARPPSLVTINNRHISSLSADVQLCQFDMATIRQVQQHFSHWLPVWYRPFKLKALYMHIFGQFHWRTKLEICCMLRVRPTIHCMIPQGHILDLVFAFCHTLPGNSIFTQNVWKTQFLAGLDEVQEELLYYPRRRHWRWR